MAEFRRATGDLRSTFDEHMRELEREAQLRDLQRREEERNRQDAINRNQAAALDRCYARRVCDFRRPTAHCCSQRSAPLAWNAGADRTCTRAPRRS